MNSNEAANPVRQSASDFDRDVLGNGIAQTAEPLRVVPQHRALRYLDVAAPLLAAPVALALGAPVVGYALGAAAWILMRVLGAAADLRASAMHNVAQLVSLRLAYRFTRVSLLVAVSVLAFKSEGRADGLAALLVITFAYTIQLSLSIIHRPRLPHQPEPPDLGSG